MCSDVTHQLLLPMETIFRRNSNFERLRVPIDTGPDVQMPRLNRDL